MAALPALVAGDKLADQLDGDMMTEIGAFEAKNKLSALLDQVERGEEVVITRRGRAVAKLVPIEEGADRNHARDAARHIRELARAMNLGPFDWEEWKRYRDEGRR